ncbi:MAG: universal stress protein, partial [Pseudomonadota bacterium]
MIEQDESIGPAKEEGVAGAKSGERIFLVVVDQTEEMETALYFACKRAYRTGGRVAMLYVIEPPEFQHWLGVERVMEDEAREEAEEQLQAQAERVQAIVGKMPVLHVRQGTRRDELMALIDEVGDQRSRIFSPCRRAKNQHGNRRILIDQRQTGAPLTPFLG